MNDPELRALLLETEQVRPGQEARAWEQLRTRLDQRSNPVLAFPLGMTWPRAIAALAIVAVLSGTLGWIGGHQAGVSYASASSEAPGIYATSFYSHTARAQVIWLNGLKPATDDTTPASPKRDPDHL